mmetsp:Transcript_65041/g.178468  ORF Transcript_65041/g.178468 Transcript_65041/m.178468 type:complete len:164 (+) Transcript_65041:858-1349(+)
MVGRLIGTGGSIFKELTAKTACHIFVLDREGPPPGAPEDERIVVCLGTEAQVGHATYEIDQLLNGSKKLVGGTAPPGAYMHDNRSFSGYRGPTLGDSVHLQTRDSFAHGRTYGTHDWSGVGVGPRPFLDVTTVNEQSLALQIGPQVGPASGMKRGREDSGAWR